MRNYSYHPDKRAPLTFDKIAYVGSPVANRELTIRAVLRIIRYAESTEQTQLSQLIAITDKSYHASWMRICSRVPGISFQAEKNERITNVYNTEKSGDLFLVRPDLERYFHTRDNRFLLYTHDKRENSAVVESRLRC